jgi:alpha-L-arabinofuranosidase
MNNFRTVNLILHSKTILIIILLLVDSSIFAVGDFYNPKDFINVESHDTTFVTVKIPDKLIDIDPMIYGQMLEDCDDDVIYDGIVNIDGSERLHVTKLLKALDMPVVRWPGGSFVYCYDWEKGIGPLSKRPTVENVIWGGVESHLFGTDEFLAWCNRLNVRPYINLNMGHKPLQNTLEDALNWIEYVNGAKNSKYGKKRIINGHAEPYNVKIWGIGNEDYNLGAGGYAEELNKWAKNIRSKYADLQLLAVGASCSWDSTVLAQNGDLIDFITHHHSVYSYIKEGKIIEPEFTIFGPLKIELHLMKLGEVLNKFNLIYSREENPVRLSIDEWNNRYLVHDGKEYLMTRKEPRRVFDVPVISGMFNVFIRQSPVVGMANYMFPVNGHGLIKTIGDSLAYKTPTYYVFEKYRHWMTGARLESVVDGTGISASDINKYKISGTWDDIEEVVDNRHLNFVDVATVLANDSSINVSLINRSTSSTQLASIRLPQGYIAKAKWELYYNNINAFNSETNPDLITPKISEIIESEPATVCIPPCGLVIIQCEKK